jgi:phytoene synthase
VFSKELGHVVHRLLYAAEGYYSHASAGVARLPVKCRFGIGAASLLYREIGNEVARRGMNSINGRAVVSGRRKLWVLASGLGNVAFPVRSLRPAPVPEGIYLVDAVVETPMRPMIHQAQTPWWKLADRLVWTLDLFARMEQRERLQSEYN